MILTHSRDYLNLRVTQTSWVFSQQVIYVTSSAKTDLFAQACVLRKIEFM